MRSFIALAIAISIAISLAACHGPDTVDPPGGARDAAFVDGPPVDASRSDAPVPDATLADGAITDAAVDGAPADAAIDAPIDAMPIDAAIDAAVDAPIDPCATPPTGEWEGVARRFNSGGASSDETRAQLRWVLASTTACVDHYRPTGTVSYLVATFCAQTTTPETVPVGSGDGELVIDRTTSPPTYRMTGSTTWNASPTCAGDPPEPPAPVGGEWADLGGSFDGDVLGGGYDDDFNAITWRFTRVGATFAPPGPGCSEPAQARWAGVHDVQGRADVTWTRVSTEGCVDRFTPSGTATAYSSNDSCTTIVTNPPSAPVEPGDGELVVDRSTDPPTFRIRGDSAWSGTMTCTHPDGSVETSTTGTVGFTWAWFIQGSFDGSRWSGHYDSPQYQQAWSLRRIP